MKNEQEWKNQAYAQALDIFKANKTPETEAVESISWLLTQTWGEDLIEDIRLKIAAEVVSNTAEKDNQTLDLNSQL